MALKSDQRAGTVLKTDRAMRIAWGASPLGAASFMFEGFRIDDWQLQLAFIR